MAVIDFATFQDNNGLFDIVIGNNLDFQYVQGWDSLFIYQIFVDRRGTKIESAIPRSRQGWIGDLATKQSGYESGSLLWAKQQSRNTPADLNEVAAFTEHALNYFVNAGIANQVAASVNNGVITGTIIIDKNNINQFTVLWNKTGKPT